MRGLSSERRKSHHRSFPETWVALLRALLLSITVLFATACTEQEPDQSRNESVANAQLSARHRVQDRVTREFPRARQLMPTGVDPDNLYFVLAPLFFIEGESFPKFGVLAESEPHSLRPGPMTLYVRESKGFVAGAERRVISYVWWEQLGNEFRPQGLRMVLSKDGMPRLYEVLSDSSQSRVFYVSARTELLAKKQFKRLGADRKFYVENPEVADDQAIVARMLADGPIPLGPWVYMEGLSGDVTSLICRCMPSQMKGPVKREDYVLMKWPKDTDQLFPFDERPVNGDGAIDSLMRLADL